MCKTFGLKAFQTYLESNYYDHFKNHEFQIEDKDLKVLDLCSQDLQKKMLSDGPRAKTVNLKSSSFESMSTIVRYELWKNTIIHGFKIVKSRQNILELQSIFNYFDLIIFNDRVADLCPHKDFLEPSPLLYDTHTMLEKISCDKSFEDSATLILGDKTINVKSFLLTDNSPVFKAMLQSTSFKEGQTKTIELPGKCFNEIVYFLHHLIHPNLVIQQGKFENYFQFCSLLQLHYSV